MKMIESRYTRHSLYLTADDAPVCDVAAFWLDRVQRYCGGIRGYGGPVSGQWLKLTRSQHANYKARVQHAAATNAQFP